MDILGHIIGFIATGLFFLSYQFSDKKKLLFIQIVAVALLCLQYILIGAYSGFGLNIVCVIRNVLYYYKDKKFLSTAFLPVIPALAMIIISAFFWEGYYSLLIIFGLVANTLCMGYFNSQNLRKSVLLTSSCILLYDVIVGSYSGILNEGLSVISAAVGIMRFKNSSEQSSEV